MARRKDMTPPFEIMGKSPPRRPWHERGRPGRGGGGEADDEAGGGDGGASSVSLVEGLSPKQWKQWLTHSGPPLVLRVPRGLAIAVVAGVLGLLVLAYWVGLERGEAAAERLLGANATQTLDRLGRVPGGSGANRGGPDAGPTGNHGATSNVTSGGGTASGGGGGGEVIRIGRPGSAGDPRQAGLNYLVLATWNPTDARRLAEFVSGYGVATLLEPYNNTRLRVLVVDRGFPPGEGDAMRAFRREMLEVGKAWQRHNNGRGTALTDMHFDKFEG